MNTRSEVKLCISLLTGNILREMIHLPETIDMKGTRSVWEANRTVTQLDKMAGLSPRRPRLVKVSQNGREL